MYQHDPDLDDLLRRPMQMATNEEFDDYEDEDDEDDLFGADLLAAAQQEREEEEREAADFAASLLGAEAEPEVPVEEAAPEAPPEPPKLFTRPGIRRNLIGYAALTLFGLIPLVLLFVFWAAGGLSPLMALFAILLIAGLGFSAYNLIYSFQHGYEFTVSFNVRSFFKLWPECTVISVVLIGMSLFNLSQIDAGRGFSLSGKSIAVAPESAPANGKMGLSGESIENEEVIFSSFKLAQAAHGRARHSSYNRNLYGRHQAVAKAAVQQPATQLAAVAPAGKAAPANAKIAAAKPAAAAHQAAAAKPAAAVAPAHESAPAAEAMPVDNAMPADSNTGMGAAAPAAESTLANTQEARNASGASVGIVGARTNLGEKANQMFAKPIGGAGVGLIGAAMDKLNPLATQPRTKSPDVLGSDNPMINAYFLGGSLCAAFGYALLLGLAGAIFGGLRKFETPFSQKTVEIINIETGEVTSDVRPIAPIMQPLNIAARILIGMFYGSTLGFALGVCIIVPLYLLFHNALLNPAAPSAVILQALGMAKMPDLAFSNAITVGGLMIPLVMLIVAKMSPQGMSISEELMRQHYEIKPTGKYLAPDQMAAVALGGNPAAISFEIPPDQLETELATTRLMNELSHDDDNLTSEIIEEFGREFENVFGIDTRELITQPRGAKQTVVDRKRLASALDESFGELGNVPVEISAELGSANLPITEWLNLREGTLVLLDKPANEEIDILFNGVRKGKGKLVVSDNALSVKVSTTNFQGGEGNGKLV